MIDRLRTLLRRAGEALALLFALAPPAPAQVVACPPTAQAPAPTQVQPGPRQARDRGFLWRLRKDGHVSYLYGTVHVARQDWTIPGPAVMSALRASDVVALELDVLITDQAFWGE